MTAKSKTINCRKEPPGTKNRLPCRVPNTERKAKFLIYDAAAETAFRPFFTEELRCSFFTAVPASRRKRLSPENKSGCGYILPNSAEIAAMSLYSQLRIFCQKDIFGCSTEPSVAQCAATM